MIKHDFYADPTVFDHWQNNAGGWLCSWLGRLCPYGWFCAFLFVAGVCALIGITVSLNLLQHAIGWNHMLAQGVTVLIALIATISLLDQAIAAWPGTDLPAFLARLASARGCADSAADGVTRQTVNTQVQSDAVQKFFAEVRAAGVNVTIARALFLAGIRSAEHLTATPDAELLAIPGVGPATLHRLRSRFIIR